MHVVSIYNNKGGVGKSTIVICLAEFLASNRKKKVLVIDLDAQASSSCSLLRNERNVEAMNDRRTVVDLVAELLGRRGPARNVDQFLTIRPSTEAKGTTLEEIAVLVPDKSRMEDLENRMLRANQLAVLRDQLRPAIADFDYVLIDLPGNVKRRDALPVAGLVMSDFVLIPVEPSQMALGALPDTFDIIMHAREVGGNGRPEIVGMLCNKTDRREEQYRSKFPAIKEAAASKDLPPLFENILPDTPKLKTATDDLLEFATLKEKFGTYYDHARKVTIELDQRCASHRFARGPELSRAARIFRKLFMKHSPR